MKDLYLMRHGQTFFNQEGLVQGACDSPLTELGQNQARQAGAYLKERGIRFGQLYSSTQERASDTLELISRRTDYTRLKGIKEWNFGLFEAQPERLQPKFRPGATSFEDLFVPYGKGKELLEGLEKHILYLNHRTLRELQQYHVAISKWRYKELKEARLLSEVVVDRETGKSILVLEPQGYDEALGVCTTNPLLDEPLFG